jgi:hypothetical protein
MLLLSYYHKKYTFLIFFLHLNSLILIFTDINVMLILIFLFYE